MFKNIPETENSNSKQISLKHLLDSEIPLIRSPMRLLMGRSSPSPPGAFSNSLQSADLAQPGIPANSNPEADIRQMNRNNV